MKHLICGLLVLSVLGGLISCQNAGSNGSEALENAIGQGTVSEGGLVDSTAPHSLKLTWNQGYIGAYNHSDAPWGIVEGEPYYSYTDIFCIEKAGTTICFLDDDSTSGGNSGRAQSDVLVLSTWVEKDGEWVIDRLGANYAGSTPSRSDIVSYQGDGVLYTYTTTNDNEYLRLCYHSGQTASFTPNNFVEVIAQLTGKKGTAKDYLDEVKWMKGSNMEYYDILNGLTLNLIGDSYLDSTVTNEGWPDKMWFEFYETKYNMKVTSHGKASSTVSNYVLTNNPMCDRYMRLPDNGANIIIVQGGRNDFNQNVPIGVVDSKDTKTFCGALNVIIDGLQEAYPDAMIVCLSPWNFPGTNKSNLSYQNYVNGMKRVAVAQGVYFIDASDVDAIGVDMQNTGFRNVYCMDSGDISHLNQKGMKLVFPRFEKILAEYYADFMSK